MKILVVGSDKIYAIENFYTKYLRELGEEVLLFPAQAMFYDHYGKSIVNKVLYRLGLSTIDRRINRELKKRIEESKPDVIWAFKGMEIFPGTWAWAKQRGIKLVNYNPDNPFVFSGKGSGNKNVTDSIGLFDLHFTYNCSVKDRLEKDFDMRVSYLPFGFDVPAAVREKAGSQPEVLRLCFLGNPDEARAAFIRQMAEAGVPVDVYGNDWNKFLNHDNIQIFNPVYGDELWLTLYRYRVQLNLMRLHNPDSHNMRTFEVPGVGGIMLAPLTKEHAMFFGADREAFFYTDVESAVQKARLLLGMDAAEAEKIRSAASARSVRSGYSYRDRTVFALGVMRGLTGDAASR